MRKVAVIMIVALIILACGITAHLMFSGAVDLPNPHGAIQVLGGLC